MELWEMVVSPVCGRVRFALEVKRLNYTSHVHVPWIGDRKLQKIAPKVMVPTLVDGRQVIQGSDEILAHIENKSPVPNLLGENDEERTKIARYVAVFHELMPMLRTDSLVRARKNLERYSKELPLGILPAFIRVPMATRALDKFSDKYRCDERNVAQVRDRITEILRTIAPQLKPGEYLVGNRLTDADIAICELTLLFRPPGDQWLKIGSATRDVYHADWIDGQISYPFEVWRDELYQSHRSPRQTFAGAD